MPSSMAGSKKNNAKSRGFLIPEASAFLRRTLILFGGKPQVGSFSYAPRAAASGGCVPYTRLRAGKSGAKNPGYDEYRTGYEGKWRKVKQVQHIEKRLHEEFSNRGTFLACC